MNAIKSFFEPITIRWLARSQCSCCGERVTRKCVTHGTRICGHAFCRTEHRRMKASVSGSLTRPFCEWATTNTLLDHVIHAAAVFVTAVAFIWFFAVLGVF